MPEQTLLCASNIFYYHSDTRIFFRLHGITKSVSRYPTFRRRFDSSMKIILEELGKKNEDSRRCAEPLTIPRSRSMFARIFSQKSLRGKTSYHGYDQEAQAVGAEREVEIQ